MAQQPNATPANTGHTPRFNETATAIGVSLAISLVLATLMTGNPLRATILAYTDYSATPAAGAEKASTTNAPDTQGPRK